MAIEPGEPLLSGELTESRPGTTAVNAGDAVTLAGGEMAPAADTDSFGGIAIHDDTNGGFGNSALLKGVVLANVNTTDANGAVVEGTLLTPSPTAGELYRDYSLDANGNPVYDQTGTVLALTDEGGTWHGANQTYNVPAGYAVVYVRRPYA